jgi:hypothetical protein
MSMGYFFCAYCGEGFNDYPRALTRHRECTTRKPRSIKYFEPCTASDLHGTLAGTSPKTAFRNSLPLYHLRQLAPGFEIRCRLCRLRVRLPCPPLEVPRQQVPEHKRVTQQEAPIFAGILDFV